MLRVVSDKCLSSVGVRRHDERILVREGTGRLLGFLLGLVPLYLDRRRRARAHWAALSAEAEIGERLARAYLTDGVAAPLYRLPMRPLLFPSLRCWLMELSGRRRDG